MVIVRQRVGVKGMNAEGRGLAGVVVEVEVRTVGKGGLVWEVSIVVVVVNVLEMGLVEVKVEGVEGVSVGVVGVGVLECLLCYRLGGLAHLCYLLGRRVQYRCEGGRPVLVGKAWPYVLFSCSCCVCYVQYYELWTCWLQAY